MTAEPIDPSFTLRVPTGDTLPRDVCNHCGFVHYLNPKIVVGAVATWDGQYLLCRRAIEPRKGYWTIPAGFMELGECVEGGVLREAYEEARARLLLDGLLGIYSIPRISQVQLLYRARLISPDVAAGEESEQVALLPWEDIPWGDLAFPSVGWSLRRHRDVVDQVVFAPFHYSHEGSDEAESDVRI